jgi:hypothetical protein
LNSRISETEDREEDNAALIDDLLDGASSSFDSIAASASSYGSKVRISGEAGVAFFAGELNTQFPNDEYRVDEARLFVEAEVAPNVYFSPSLFLFNRDK